MQRLGFVTKWDVTLSILVVLLCGLGASAQMGHSVTVAWIPSPQATNETMARWNVYRSTADGSPFTLLASVPVDTIMYQDVSVAPGNDYSYVVTTVDTANMESEPSASAKATIPAPGVPLPVTPPTPEDFIGWFRHTSASASPGGQASYVLTLIPFGGFTGNVTLIPSGLPPGATASFSPAVVARGSGPSTLTVTTATTTPVGNYTLTISGSSGPLVHTTTITLLVGTVDFTGSITPTSQNVSASAGGNAQYTISLTALGTQLFGGGVALSVSGLPPGMTESFIPRVIYPDANGSSVLTLAASSATPLGSYTLLITATNGVVTHAGNITLTVTP